MRKNALLLEVIANKREVIIQHPKISVVLKDLFPQFFVKAVTQIQLAVSYCLISVTNSLHFHLNKFLKNRLAKKKNFLRVKYLQKSRCNYTINLFMCLDYL